MTYRFDDIEIDAEGFRVTKAGASVRLEPKALEVLLFLAANAGRLVTKAEIQAAVWTDTFVTENALTRLVAQIRKGLGDDARDACYIETVPTRGYRFVASLERGGTGRVPLWPSSKPRSTRGRGRARADARLPRGRPSSPSSSPRRGCAVVGPSVDHRRDPGRPLTPRGREADQHERRPQRLPLLLAGRRFDRLRYAAERLDGDRGPGSGVGGDRGGAHERRDAERPARLLSRRSADRFSLGGARRDLAHSRVGGVARQLVSFGSNPTWSPDGSLIAFQSQPWVGSGENTSAAGEGVTLWLVPSFGGEPRPLTSIEEVGPGGRAPRRGRPTAG